MTHIIFKAALVFTMALCPFNASVMAQTSQATPATIAANAALSSTLPWSDESEAVLSRRGFVATLSDPKIRNAAGEVVMDLSAWDFATGTAPATANPSLWRHAGLLRQHGLYKVTDKIWQVRGFDISVMSIIETDNGYVIVDPLTSVESARAAMGLVRQHVGDKPIKAVIYTHSHADHFAGVKGVVDPADVASGKVMIIAPDGFMEHAISENLTAGPAMSRRAAYQFGTTLAAGPAGHLGAGIGMAVSAGTLSLIPPTYTVKTTGETLVVDGLKIEFQYTPGTEAPSEMNFFLPDLNALCLAENANMSMHNVLPPRGALVRDSKAWADHLTQSLALYGDRTDVMFVSHGWPRWGREAINQYVSRHRDAYKYLHDQSVRLMNQGLTGSEISEQITLPEVLSRQWYNRGYYGTMKHNSRAVYQRYLGWYDGNPANLNNVPPEEAGERYVAAMGGARKALRIANAAYEAGDYRWSAEVASRVVFADRNNVAAREVLAKSFEQMAYQAESMLWRNMYLVGATEARATPTVAVRSTVALDLIGATQTSQLFDLLAIRVDPAKSVGKDVAVAFVFPERNERIRVTLNNSVLIHQNDASSPQPPAVQATITMPRPAFLGMLFAGTTPASLMQSGTMLIDGDRAALQGLLGSLDGAPPTAPFPIATP